MKLEVKQVHEVSGEERVGEIAVTFAREEIGLVRVREGASDHFTLTWTEAEGVSAAIQDGLAQLRKAGVIPRRPGRPAMLKGGTLHRKRKAASNGAQGFVVPGAV